jgi:5'(3')-deoxyribonucleotidase
MKTIAIDLDDTLNNFADTLQNTRFSHNPAYGISAETFDTYLRTLRSGAPDGNELLSTEYSYFCHKIHVQCYQLAHTRPGAVEFMQWLRTNDWRIVICTHRDLRRSNECTRQWLQDNGIPFDYLFRALNKLEFCRLWGINILVDDHVLNLIQEGTYEVEVFHPNMSKHEDREFRRGRGFTHFEELKQWIQK